MHKENRSAIIALHKQGIKAGAIIEMSGFVRQTVYDVIKIFHELGTLEDRPRNGRPPTAVTPANLNKVRCRI